MSPKMFTKRLTAVKFADAVNKIEGVPVTAQAKKLSTQWARGEISGSAMKSALIAKHKRKSTGTPHE